MLVLERLLRRPEFLAAAAKGRKWVAPGLVVQLLPQPEGKSIRYGLTASRKVGGAVVRNRARRRMRALAESLLPASSLPPCDVVLIARPTATVSRKFEDMKADFATALAKLRPR
jgi:ribonuclease P protein component